MPPFTPNWPNDLEFVAIPPLKLSREVKSNILAFWTMIVYFTYLLLAVESRSAEALTAYAMSLFRQYEEEKLPIEIVEMVDQPTFDKVCGDTTCILMIVPDIRDAGKAKRVGMLDLFERIASKQTRSMFSFGWFVVGFIDHSFDHSLDHSLE